MLDTSVDSFHFYFLVAVLQGVVLALLIGFQKPFKGSSVFFGLIVFLISLSLLHGVLEESIHAFNTRFLFPMEYGFALGPITYFHVLYIVDPNFRLRSRHLLHFVPSLVFDVILFFAFFGYAGNNAAWAEANIRSIQIFFLAVALLFILYTSGYIYKTGRTAFRAEIKPREYDPPVRRWLKIFIGFWVIMLIIQVVTILAALLDVDLLDEQSYIVYNPMGVLKALCIYLLGYLFLLKYRNVIGKYLVSNERSLATRYSPDEVLRKKEQLTALLEQGQVYKDEKLSLEKLAQHLNWPVKEVSAVISEAFDSNFNDLINAWRVKAFQELATKAENQKYSIMGIASQVGFNSKASFYRAFKKECGQTPTEFLALKGVK